MEDLDKRLKSYLILTAGFSRGNAERAISMYHADELTEIEKEVINKIRLDPENDDQAVVYYGNKATPVLGRLNYRLTLDGGQAVTPNPRHIRKI